MTLVELRDIVLQNWKPRAGGKLDCKLGNSCIKIGGGTIYLRKDSSVQTLNIPYSVVEHLMNSGVNVIGAATPFNTLGE